MPLFRRYVLLGLQTDRIVIVIAGQVDVRPCPCSSRTPKPLPFGVSCIRVRMPPSGVGLRVHPGGQREPVVDVECAGIRDVEVTLAVQ